MRIGYFKAVELTLMFAECRIIRVPFFQRKRNFQSKSFACWAIEEILNRLYEAKDFEYGDVDVIAIIDEFISTMEAFLDIRYFEGFACAKGTATRLKRFILEEIL